MNAGKALDLSAKGQMISVMVALGESGLRVLDYRRRRRPGLPGVVPAARQRRVGLLRGPHGPHHQRDELHQGPAEACAGWELLEPTIAGNKVQRNADPYHYQKYWPEAVKLVQALSNSKFSLQGSDCAIPGQSGAGDDYPWKNSPTWLQAGANTASTSPLGMYYRECVDFALWRVNQQMGSTSAPFKFLNGTFRPDGQQLGSAVTWKAGWDAKGWPTGSTPRVGAVVWYAPGAGGADPTLRPRRRGQGRQGQRDLSSKRATTATRPRTTTATTPGQWPTLSPQLSCTCPLKRRRSEKAPDPARRGAALRVLRTGGEHDAGTGGINQPAHSVRAGLTERQQRTPGARRHGPGHHRHHLGSGQQGRGHGRRREGHDGLRPPHVEDKQWANDLARWLTPQATADYSAVDPANIPVSRVTGPATLERR